MKTFERDDLQWENRQTVSVSDRTLREAQDQIASCEACTPDEADILFDDVLDVLTGCDPKCTDYSLAEPALCPRCDAAIHTGRWEPVTGAGGERSVSIEPGSLVRLKELWGQTPNSATKRHWKLNHRKLLRLKSELRNVG